MLKRYVLLLFLIAGSVAPGEAFAAALEKAGTAANPGFVGLWEYPTAEMPADGTGRFGATHASPYSFYYIDLAWLPWLEVNTRLTTFDNIYVAPDGPINVSGVGRDYMDKAIDVKAMLHRSDKWYLPSVAFGVTDVMGTELMHAWYGVATWHVNDLAFSLGYGTDRMNGPFAGVSWAAAPWLTLKAEYSPMDYTLDGAGGHKTHPAAAKAKYNVGAVMSAPWGTEFAMSWQRGEEFVYSLSQQFDLTGTFFGKPGEGRNTVYDAPGGLRTAEWDDIAPQDLSGAIIDALAEHVRVRDVEVALGEKSIYVAYENYGHSSHAEAMTRVLVVVAAVSPHADAVFLLPRVRGVPVICAEFPGDVLFGVRARDLTDEDLWQATRFTWAEKNFFEALGEQGALSFRSERSLQDRARHEFKAMAVYEPRIDRTLDDDYQNRWSIDLLYKGRFSNGWAALADVRFPLWNDVDISWEPWMNDRIRLQRALLSYLHRTEIGTEGAPRALWSLGEAGWLDAEYFGVNGWQRVYSKNGRWWLGGRIAAARNRDPLSFAGMAEGQIDYTYRWRDNAQADPWLMGAWVQAGYNFTALGLDAELSYGRFLDADKGVKLSLTRRWDDVSVGFWMSRTDNLTPGKDFTDTGVSLELPAERWFGSLFGNPSGHVWEQDISLLSTWRIDAGREPGDWQNPDHLLSQLRPIELRKNVKNLLEEYCAFESHEAPEQRIQGLTDYLQKVM